MRNLKKLEMFTFNCQVGMYFSGIKKLVNGFIVYSGTVLESGWNFWTGFKAKTIEEFENAYKQAKKVFKEINRKPCFVIAPNTKISKNVKEYIDKKYKMFANSVTLLTHNFKPLKEAPNKISFRKIDNTNEADLFIKVFKTSKSQAKPNDTYKPLSEDYFKALKNSFENNHEWDFVHYISMENNKPIGMVSACVKNKWCGLYGGGTYLKHRGKGVFSSLLKFVQADLKKQGVKYFFGMTSKDSYNEKLYNAINFKSVFENKYYK